MNRACGDQICDFEFFGVNTATRQSSVEALLNSGVELKREVAGFDLMIRLCAFGRAGTAATLALDGEMEHSFSRTLSGVGDLVFKCGKTKTPPSVI